MGSTRDRRIYNPGTRTPKRYRVLVNWDSSRWVRIEACSREEAEEKATGLVLGSMDTDYVVDSINVLGCEEQVLP